MSYEAPNGLVYTAYSDTAAMIVAQVGGVDIEPPRSTIGDPNMTVVFPHTLVNVGNGTDSIAVSCTLQTGWPLTMYRDANANGALDAGDTPLSGPVTLAMGETASLLVAVSVPGSATVRGTVDTITVSATSLFDGTMTDQLQDVLEIRDVGILVTLNKVVDRASGTIGDILTYTINYVATGSGSASNLQITDAIPVGTSYVPGTMRWNGASLTDAAGDDAGYFDVGNNRVVFPIGAIAGGENGTLEFQVRVEG